MNNYLRTETGFRLPRFAARLSSSGELGEQTPTLLVRDLWHPLHQVDHEPVLTDTQQNP